MAVAHIFYLVMTNPPSSPPQQPSSSSPNRTPRTPSNSTTVESHSPSSPYRGEVSSSEGLGGRFVSKVLDKGGLAGMVEVLRDGPPKLQQAYLIIIAIVFCPQLSPEAAQQVNSSSTRHVIPAGLTDRFPEIIGRDDDISAERAGVGVGVGVGMVRPLSADSHALRSTRQLFLRASGLLPALQRLLEQGASSSVRAKALVTLQLLSQAEPSLLGVLVERRLPYVMTKVLDPLILSQPGQQGCGAGVDLEDSTGGADGAVASAGGGAAVPVSYTAKAAMSMVVFIRELGGRYRDNRNRHFLLYVRYQFPSTFGDFSLLPPTFPHSHAFYCCCVLSSFNSFHYFSSLILSCYNH